jgi:hypothetical protein
MFHGCDTSWAVCCVGVPCSSYDAFLGFTHDLLPSEGSDPCRVARDRKASRVRNVIYLLGIEKNHDMNRFRFDVNRFSFYIDMQWDAAVLQVHLQWGSPVCGV